MKTQKEKLVMNSKDLGPVIPFLPFSSYKVFGRNEGAIRKQAGL
jgi:hypothetical protein